VIVSSSNDANPLSQLADGVWTSPEPVSFLGLRLSANMTIVRLPDGSLLLYAPVAMTPERRAAVEALGRIAHLYAPNTFHHLFIGEWIAAFPNARVHAPRALAKKRTDLRIDRFHGAPPDPALEGVVDEVAIDGFMLEETVIYVRSARTLIVADLVHNIGRPTHAWTAFYTRAMGFYDRVGLSRVIRWTAFRDRAAARKSLDRVLALPFERIAVGHGAAVVVDARESLAQTYAWLRA